MTLMLTNSSMDNFENQLSFLSEEVNNVLAEAEQLLLDMSGTTRNNSNTSNNDTVPFNPPIASNANNAEDSSSDVEEILSEIPVIELDCTVDAGPRNSTNTNDAGHDSQDDDIIFVQQTLNANPVTIDLCNDTFIGPIHSTPNPSSRRRRARSPVGLVVLPDEIPERRARVDPVVSAGLSQIPRLLPRPPPNAIVKPPDLDDTSVASQNNSSLPFKCPICLESAIKKEPMSTICGHVFCKACITRCISQTLHCPMCKKKLNIKNVHRIYLS